MDYPNDVIRVLFEKHTIRRFKPDPVERASLELIVEAGWARKWARDAGVPDAWEGCFHLCLGYPSDWGWSPKPRHPDRLLWT